MSSGYLYMPQRATEMLRRFRERWAGKTPRDNIDWMHYQRDKASVLGAIDPETRKSIYSDRNAQTEYRRFLGELTEGEPRVRTVAPTIVHGTLAASQARDADGYERDLAARASNFAPPDEE